MFPFVFVALVVAALAILFVVRQRASHGRSAGARRRSRPQQARRVAADKVPAPRNAAPKPAQNRTAAGEPRATTPAKPAPRHSTASTLSAGRSAQTTPTRSMRVPSAAAAAIVRTLRGESAAGGERADMAGASARQASVPMRGELSPQTIPVRGRAGASMPMGRAAPSAKPTQSAATAPPPSIAAPAMEAVAVRAPLEEPEAFAAAAPLHDEAAGAEVSASMPDAPALESESSAQVQVAAAAAGFEPSASPTQEPAHAQAIAFSSAYIEPPQSPARLVPASLQRASNDDVPALSAVPMSAPVPTAVNAQHPRAAALDAEPARPKVRVDLPPLDLLSIASEVVDVASPELLDETSRLIEQRLREFKVPVTVLGASAGPVITRFEVEPAIGVRGNQIVALMKDLARGLGRTSIRVVETIPGKTCMGLELPNEKRQMIGLADILRSAAYRRPDSPLTLAMGKDITGEPVVTDLARAPHMLVAGTTGSGKSVAVNAMILSMLYKATPEEVRLILIDPKMLELSVYEGIPHLLAPVVTDMKLAANALNWCVVEMEDRYRLMSELRVRNLAGYNAKIRAARAAGTPLRNPVSKNLDEPELLDTLPMIVVVIDELADLMMVAGKKIEELIARLAQKARAAGIHLILATQRPSVDVITGLIKANIPTRVAFQVSSKIDSRTILDQMGAESLLGQGDMLFLPPGTGYPQRVHGAFVGDEEVHRVVAWLKQFGEPDYRADILAGPASEAAPDDLFGEAEDAEADPLYDEAVAFVVRSRRASISSVQRQFRIGYNRAARLVESMEAAGLVSALGRNGVREVLAPGAMSDEL